MTDPLGLIGSGGSALPLRPSIGGPGQTPVGGPGFKEVLDDQIQRVNQLQQDARAAMEDLATGRRDDVESVLIATQKADTAFRLLLQVRNKVMAAYEEVKSIRV